MSSGHLHSLLNEDKGGVGNSESATARNSTEAASVAVVVVVVVVIEVFGVSLGEILLVVLGRAGAMAVVRGGVA